MKSIAKKACLGAAALTVAAAGALTVGPEFGPAAAKPNPPCSKASDCAGAAGNGGVNSDGKAQGSRVVTTAAGTPTVVTIAQGSPVPNVITCASQSGCDFQLAGGNISISDGGIVVFNQPATCISGCVFATVSPPTTITQEGSANGGRTVSQVGSSAPSTVTGH